MLALCIIMMVRIAHSQPRETIWYYDLDAEEPDWSGDYSVTQAGDCIAASPFYCWDVGGGTAEWTKSTGSLLDDYHSIRLTFSLSALGLTSSKGCVVDYSTNNGITFNDIFRTTDWCSTCTRYKSGNSFDFGNPSSLSIRLSGSKGNLNCYFSRFAISGIPITSNPTRSPTRNPSLSPTHHPSVSTRNPSRAPTNHPSVSSLPPTLFPSASPSPPPSMSPTATTYWSAWINSRSYVGGTGYGSTTTRTFGPHSNVRFSGFSVSTYSCTLHFQYSGAAGSDGSGDPIDWCDMRGQQYTSSTGQCFKGIQFRFAQKFGYPIIQYIRFQQTDGSMKGYSSYSWSYHKAVYADGPNDCIIAAQVRGGRASAGSDYPEQMRVLFHRSWITPAPSPSPTVPTTVPTTHAPTALTAMPTQYPTPQTSHPTASPSSPNPTRNPTASPVVHVTTLNPSENPTNIPSDAPTTKPTSAPTFKPTTPPTSVPTLSPTPKPTAAPLTPGAPTGQPTVQTSNPTSKPTLVPTLNPIATKQPTDNPIQSATLVPTAAPSAKQTLDPTQRPTIAPTRTDAPQTSLPTDGATIGPTTSTARTTAVPSRSTTVKPSSSSTTNTPTITDVLVSTRNPDDKGKKDVSNVDKLELIPTIIPGVSNVVGGLVVLMVGLTVIIGLCVCLCKWKNRNKGNGQIINESDVFSETELAQEKVHKELFGKLKEEGTLLTKGKQETMESIVVAEDSDESDAEMATPMGPDIEESESHAPPPPEPRAKCVECGKYSTGQFSDAGDCFYCNTCYQNI